MKQRSKTANIATAVVATVLSILLVLVLFAAGIVGAASNAVTPKTIENLLEKTFQNINFEEIIVENANNNNYSEEDLAQAQIVNQLMSSDAAKEFFALYAQDVAAALSGNYTADTAVMTGQAIRDLTDTHIDDMVNVLADLEPSADREKIKTELKSYIDENADTLLGELTVDNLVDTNEMDGVIQVVKILPTVLWTLIGVCFLLAILIYVCRYYGYGGWIWLAVDSAIAALMILGVAKILDGDMLLSLIGTDADQTIVSGLLSAISNVFNGTTVILFVVAAMCLAAFGLLKLEAAKKKKEAAAEAVVAAPVVEAPVQEAADDQAPV